MTYGDTVTYRCDNNLTVSGQFGVYDVNITCTVNPDDVTKGMLSPSNILCEGMSYFLLFLLRLFYYDYIYN